MMELGNKEKEKERERLDEQHAGSPSCQRPSISEAFKER